MTAPVVANACDMDISWPSSSTTETRRLFILQYRFTRKRRNINSENLGDKRYRFIPLLHATASPKSARDNGVSLQDVS